MKILMILAFTLSAVSCFAADKVSPLSLRKLTVSSITTNSEQTKVTANVVFADGCLAAVAGEGLFFTETTDNALVISLYASPSSMRCGPRQPGRPSIKVPKAFVMEVNNPKNLQVIVNGIEVR